MLQFSSAPQNDVEHLWQFTMWEVNYHSQNALRLYLELAQRLRELQDTVALVTKLPRCKRISPPPRVPYCNNRCHRENNSGDGPTMQIAQREVKLPQHRFLYPRCSGGSGTFQSLGSQTGFAEAYIHICGARIGVVLQDKQIFRAGGATGFILLTPLVAKVCFLPFHLPMWKEVVIFIS